MVGRCGRGCCLGGLASWFTRLRLGRGHRCDQEMQSNCNLGVDPTSAGMFTVGQGRRGYPNSNLGVDPTSAGSRWVKAAEATQPRWN